MNCVAEGNRCKSRNAEPACGFQFMDKTRQWLFSEATPNCVPTSLQRNSEIGLSSGDLTTISAPSGMRTNLTRPSS